MCDSIHTTECEVIYTHVYRHTKYKHSACLAPIPTFIPVYNAIACIMRNMPYSCEQAMYCAHLSVWSVELWASAAAMCCAPSAPTKFPSRLYAHECVRRTIQRTCVDHDARSHSHNRERGHIHPCICACRHTKYKHACMPCTYTYLPTFIPAQRNSAYHAQICPTTMHSCEQAMYCTHSSVWSAELWASTVAMCCAPSVHMEFLSRLYAHVCV
jgi:hypothetical protein